MPIPAEDYYNLSPYIQQNAQTLDIMKEAYKRQREDQARVGDLASEEYNQIGNKAKEIQQAMGPEVWQKKNQESANNQRAERESTAKIENENFNREKQTAELERQGKMLENDTARLKIQQGEAGAKTSAAKADAAALALKGGMKDEDVIKTYGKDAYTQGKGKNVADVKAPSIQEQTAFGFLTSAEEGSKIADELEKSGYDPGSNERANRTAIGPLKNTLMRPQDRQYQQAVDQFTLAVLRDESGANAPEHEAVKYESMYFPVRGDGPVEKEQKRIARERKKEAMKLKSGTAANQKINSTYTVGAKKPEAGTAMANSLDLSNVKIPTQDEAKAELARRKAAGGK